MMQFTEEQKKTLIADCEMEIAHFKKVMAEWDLHPTSQAEYESHLIRQEIALAALTAKPFMYGIMDADGAAHMDECCVSTSLAGVSDSVDVLNEELTEEGDPQYKPVALFTAPIVVTPLEINKDVIREIFMRNGFTIKEGQSDLKNYVYAAAYELLRLNAAAPAAMEEK